MKVTWIVLFSCIAAVFTLPAGREEEVEFVPLEAQSGKPIIDTGVIGDGPWLGGPGPFDGLFESFAALMSSMRQQMDYLMRRLPFRNATVDTPFPGIIGIPDIDLSKGNTTSVTKVIDGHKVVINETEYKEESENGGSFFKVRIIDVLPNSSELTTDKNAENITNPPPQEVESVESSVENEIPKNKEIEDFSSVETFDEPIRGEDSIKRVLPYQKLTAGNPNWESIEPLESFEGNSVEFPYHPPDLSRDIYVNQLMADAGAPRNPDAEVFSDIEYNVPYATRRKQTFEKITNPR